METSTTPTLAKGEPATASPVFVDSSGRRRKTWRRLTIAVVAALCGYACLLGIGFAGGPIPPAALLPIPGVPGNGPASSASPSSNAAAPSSAGAETSHGTTSGTAKDPAGLFPPRAESSATSAAGSARTSAAKPTAPQPSSTASPSGTAALPTTPSGTTAVTPTSTVSSTHGPQGTPPSHSHSKTP